MWANVRNEDGEWDRLPDGNALAASIKAGEEVTIFSAQTQDLMDAMVALAAKGVRAELVRGKRATFLSINYKGGASLDFQEALSSL